MNDFEPIRSARPDEPLPDTARLAAARGRLTDAIAAADAAPRSRVRSALLAGGVAATTAAAVAVVALLASGPLSSDSGAADQALPGASAHALPPGAALPPYRPGDTAQTVLLRAASAALAQPFTEPRPDQFLYTETTWQGQRRQDWFSIDGAHPGLIAVVPGDPGHVVEPCATGEHVAPEPDSAAPAQECGSDPAYLPDLPTDAAAMGDHLEAMGGHPGTNSLAKNALHLFSSKVLRPQARAALYQATMAIPGITIKDGVVDGEGRAGVGVWWTHGGDTGVTLVFDPTTYTFLGFADGEALVTAAVVDAVGDTP